MKKKIFIYSYVTAMYLLIAWWIFLGIFGYIFAYDFNIIPLIWFIVVITILYYLTILYSKYILSGKIKKLFKQTTTTKDYLIAVAYFLGVVLLFSLIILRFNIIIFVLYYLIILYLKYKSSKEMKKLIKQTATKKDYFVAVTYFMIAFILVMLTGLYY